MKLSVILPCFNGAETIAVQLEALTRQSWAGEWEVIVVNNGSTDNSMEIVKRYRDRLQNLQIVNAYQPPEPRRGVT
ncbi:MAG: glycosyltransferase, partial [Leptolyngbyaceae cyanobacterium CAN_BIN12]|nr:glycosyltransferase [Leptolyngbyaceae cyanobacterium CAN_BIN12]